MVSIILVLSMLLIMFIGVPVVFSLGISALAAVITMGDIPLQVIPQKMFKGMDSFPLLCIPFFVLAGELMSHGRITERLLEFAVILIGRVRGGLGLANVLASMFFGGLTGSAIADVSALGSVEIPMMIKAGYDRRFSAAVTCASAVIGPVIPPSIPAVLYAISVGTSIGGLFLAGIIPGIILGLSLMITVYIISIRRKYPVREERFSFWELCRCFPRVSLALLLPVIIVAGIISGVFTPTEASAVAVGYAFLLTVFIMKTIKLSELPGILINTSIITAVVMIIAGTGYMWGWVVAMEQWSHMLGSMLENFGPIGFLLLVNVFLLFLGTFMDLIPIILIFAPTLATIANGLGIQPLHFGLVFILNTIIGLITPPLGLVLFVASPLANLKVEEIARETFVFFLISIGVLLLVTYIPFTTLWIPRILGFS